MIILRLSISINKLFLAQFKFGRSNKLWEVQESLRGPRKFGRSGKFWEVETLGGRNFGARIELRAKIRESSEWGENCPMGVLDHGEHEFHGPACAAWAARALRTSRMHDKSTLQSSRNVIPICPLTLASHYEPPRAFEYCVQAIVWLWHPVINWSNIDWSVVDFAQALFVIKIWSIYAGS